MSNRMQIKLSLLLAILTELVKVQPERAYRLIFPFLTIKQVSFLGGGGGGWLNFFLTPPALPRVQMVWFPVRRTYSLSSLTFTRKLLVEHGKLSMLRPAISMILFWRH